MPQYSIAFDFADPALYAQELQRAPLRVLDGKRESRQVLLFKFLDTGVLDFIHLERPVGLANSELFNSVFFNLLEQNLNCDAWEVSQPRRLWDIYQYRMRVVVGTTPPAPHEMAAFVTGLLHNALVIKKMKLRPRYFEPDLRSYESAQQKFKSEQQVIGGSPPLPSPRQPLEHFYVEIIGLLTCLMNVLEGEFTQSRLQATYVQLAALLNRVLELMCLPETPQLSSWVTNNPPYNGFDNSNIGVNLSKLAASFKELIERTIKLSLWQKTGKEPLNTLTACILVRNILTVTSSTSLVGFARPRGGSICSASSVDPSSVPGSATVSPAKPPQSGAVLANTTASGANRALPPLPTAAPPATDGRSTPPPNNDYEAPDALNYMTVVKLLFDLLNEDNNFYLGKLIQQDPTWSLAVRMLLANYLNGPGKPLTDAHKAVDQLLGSGMRTFYPKIISGLSSTQLGPTTIEQYKFIFELESYFSQLQGGCPLPLNVINDVFNKPGFPQIPFAQLVQNITAQYSTLATALTEKYQLGPVQPSSSSLPLAGASAAPAYAVPGRHRSGSGGRLVPTISEPSVLLRSNSSSTINDYIDLVNANQPQSPPLPIQLAGATVSLTPSTTELYTGMTNPTGAVSRAASAAASAAPPPRSPYPAENPYDSARATAATGIIAVERLVELVSGRYGIFVNTIEPIPIVGNLVEQLLIAILINPGRLWSDVFNEVTSGLNLSPAAAAKHFRNIVKKAGFNHAIVTQGKRKDLEDIFGLTTASPQVFAMNIPANGNIQGGLAIKQLWQTLLSWLARIGPRLLPTQKAALTQLYKIIYQ